MSFTERPCIKTKLPICTVLLLRGGTEFYKEKMVMTETQMPSELIIQLKQAFWGY